MPEQFPKSVKRFSDKNCGKTQELERFAEPSEAKTALALDHCIFPVASLEEIKGLMQSLGFTLAPRAEHPFGTANICLFLPDTFYIEFLGVHDQSLYARALQDNQPFIRDIDGWYQRNGHAGFAGLAFTSQDGYADLARFKAAGIAREPIGEFSRLFTLADGTTDMASFRTVHTHLPIMPEIFCFTCQHVRVPQGDRAAFGQHVNGVYGGKKIIIGAPEPLRLRPSLTKLLDSPPSLAVPDVLGFTLPNIELIVLTPAALMEAYGIEIKLSTPRLIGLVLVTNSLEKLAQQWAENNITHHKHGTTFIHPLFEGGEVFLGFETS